MDYRFADRWDGIEGSAIRAIFSLLSDPEMISFAGGNPSPVTFPKEDLRDLSFRILDEEGDSVLQYGGTAGTKDALNTVKSLLRDEGLDPEDGEVITLTGSSQGIELMTKVFINPGDRMVVESPTFLGALQTFNTYQAEILEAEMDENGIIPEKLDALISGSGAKFLYTIPTFQNPTGRTLTEERRKAVYDICLKHGVLILEDDPYMLLRYSGKPLRSIKSFDTEDIVVKLMSFSKTISPGLRLGAAYGNKEIIRKFNLGKQGMDVHTSNLTQQLVARYIESGKYYAHVKENCAIYSGKCALMAELAKECFPAGTSLVTPEGGMFIWAELPEEYNCTDLFKKAVEKKVAYVPGTHFYNSGGHNNTLRLNFTMADPDTIKEGMSRLSRIFE